MARLRLAATVVATLSLMVRTGMAFAVQENVIEEGIATADVPVALLTVAEELRRPSLLSGVTVGGTLLGVSEHLGDGRVDVDHRPLAARTRSRRSYPAKELGDHPVQLADMTKRERT